MLTLTPLHREIVQEDTDIDELRDFTSLVIKIRDRNDFGINIEFERYLLYSKSDETWAGDTLKAMREAAGVPLHWLYLVEESNFLERFKERNPHLHSEWDVKHYVVVTSNDVIDVIAVKPPKVSIRSDNVRGWIRPGEERSG